MLAALDGHITLITVRLMAIMPQSRVSVCNLLVLYISMLDFVLI